MSATPDPTKPNDPPPTRANHPPVYIAINPAGSYDVHIDTARGPIVTRRERLWQATRDVRVFTDRNTGSVPCFDRATGQWTSEIDIAAGA